MKITDVDMITVEARLASRNDDPQARIRVIVERVLRRAAYSSASLRK